MLVYFSVPCLSYKVLTSNYYFTFSLEGLMFRLKSVASLENSYDFLAVVISFFSFY